MILFISLKIKIKITIFKIFSYFCGIMNTRFIRISLKKRIFISYCLIGLFFFLGENCYASKRPVFRETVRKASADNSTVRGRVVDVSGEPLIGATIREKGGTRGTVTDIEGNFILSVPDSAVLQVSFCGVREHRSQCRGVERHLRYSFVKIQ